LEQARADRKRYPAVNPIDSYSKYIEYPEFEEYITNLIDGEWLGKVNDMKTYLQRGKEIQEQINILGDDGVPVDYHEEFWKAEVIDFVVLQQDAFDKIDAVCPMERQQYILNLVMDICKHDYDFKDFNDVSTYFKRVINLCKQMNYAEVKSEQFNNYQQQLNDLLAEKQIKA
jgi:V/A-type H+-transporting ATPase subunit A